MSARKPGLSPRAILDLVERIAGKAYSAGRCDCHQKKPIVCMHRHHDSREDWKDLGRRIRALAKAGRGGAR